MTMHTTARMFTGRPAAGLIACCAALAGAPSAASAGDTFVLIDRSLRAETVDVAMIGPDALTVVDEQGGTREVPLADVVALAPGWWRPGTEAAELALVDNEPRFTKRTGAPKSVLLCTDGRRMVGRLVAENAGDRVGWDHARLGRSTYELDDVRRIRLAPTADGAAPRVSERASSDRVVMTNSDVVTGFVESIGAQVKVESDGRIVDLSLKQVSSIELNNPAKAATGTRVWLDDGSVVGVNGFGAGTNRGELRIELAAPSGANGTGGASPEAAVSLAEVTGVIFDAARVVALSSLAIAEQGGVGERRYAEPATFRWRGRTLGADWREGLDAEGAGAGGVPPLDAPDIELPGPMSVEWTLPRGAARVAGWAEIPSESRLWAEFTVRIEAVSATGVVTELAAEALSGARPVLEFNVELPSPPPARVRVSMDSGARGPIQDRLMIRRGLVLIAAPAN